MLSFVAGLGDRRGLGYLGNSVKEGYMGICRGMSRSIRIQRDKEGVHGNKGAEKIKLKLL